MDNVNDIIDMLKDRLVEATRKTARTTRDQDLADKTGMSSFYSLAELIEAQELESQLRIILYAITDKELFWSEDNQAFFEKED